MTIKFNRTEAFKEAKSVLAKTMVEGASAEEQEKAFDNYLNVLKDEVVSAAVVKAQADMMDRSILQNRGQNVLTSEETAFFQNAIDKKGFDEESILPETTQVRVFEDLTSEHPLLTAIGLQDLGPLTRIITSDPEGAAVWGKLFGDIKGQVGASFSEETITQLKLTAFAVVPNDMFDLGPEWIERYVRTIIVEVISVGLEKAFVIGTGKDEPIGLIKDLDAAVTGGVYQDKASAGTLTFEPGRKTILELKNVVKKLSTDAKGKARKVAGKIVMVVNPFDSFDIQASATVQNSNGVYVTNLPFNPQIVESEFVPEGKIIFFIQGQYLAVIAGGYKLKKFDQTLAMEDATLYTIKQFANGKARDNNATAVYNLNIADLEPAGA
ncbi:phage major capsid protein [Fictibacillus fluitans]|uniref:Phage major capsid protein n=1 Tax=Fictibacillus fluitans TaxID=3058422 RepID=A0ABT8HX19_9BACL|nr:phage major capsid protein [Fictibacillus sp. NE201]MDN4525327.1 phage major capsid protein [Fictibacillus sp. NE201]